MSVHHEVLIIGAGTAGISVAARLARTDRPPTIAIVDPSDRHFYQPIWTLVGGGVFDRSVSVRSQADLIPSGVTWIHDSADSFDPEKNSVTLGSGEVVTYDQLVVCAGIQLDWGKVDGLAGNVGKDGICSNYSFDTVQSTWDAIRGFRGGNAIFTFPSTPIKCAGAPQKIMWLAEHAFQRAGVRAKSHIIYGNAGAAIFGVPRYRDALQKLVEKREIDARHQHDLIAVRPKSREAVFRQASGEESVIKYDMLHVTPPQSAPDFIKRSPLAASSGWVDVDKHTTQHVRYPNVFSLGDASSLPCSKTAAAVRKQAPVTVENLLAFRAGRELTASYDGYASCPLVTGYGRLILAEFGYDGKIMETFPFAQNRERYSMYVLKEYLLPELYWNGMLRGQM